MQRRLRDPDSITRNAERNSSLRSRYGLEQRHAVSLRRTAFDRACQGLLTTSSRPIRLGDHADDLRAAK